MVEVKDEAKESFTKVPNISETAVHQISPVGLARPLRFTAKGDFIMTLLNNPASLYPQEDKLEILKTMYEPVWPHDACMCGTAFIDMERWKVWFCLDSSLALR